jgi:hypothetical protein
MSRNAGSGASGGASSLGAAIPLHPASEPDQARAASKSAAQTARCAKHGPRYRVSTIIALDRHPIEVKRIMSGNQLAA